VITLTGVVMSYQWANNLIYTLTGSEPPPAQPRPLAGPPGQTGTGRSGADRGPVSTMPDGRAGSQPPPGGGPAVERRERTGEASHLGAPSARAGLDVLVAAATQQAPHWRLISVRIPQRGATQTTVFIEEATSWHPYPRSILTLDAATAAVVKWEPFAGYNLGRTIRSWVRPVHTGEAGGPIGQLIAALASAGGAVLVYTGLALAWRRFWNFARRPRKVGGRGSEDAGDQDLGREATPRVGVKPL
jgi:uncharacterized iron-regulated membrane protein